MHLYLIRHGESESDVKQRYDGDYDDHLTEKGKAEAKEIAQKLLHTGIEVIVSSSRIRARETVEIICSVVGCETIVMEDFNEQDIYGAYRSLGVDQPEEEYRKLGELIANRDQEFPEAESYAHLKARVIRGLSGVMDRSEHVIGIVTHGGPIRCILREVLKLQEIGDIKNGTIIELEQNEFDLKMVE